LSLVPEKSTQALADMDTNGNKEVAYIGEFMKSRGGLLTKHEVHKSSTLIRPTWFARLLPTADSCCMQLGQNAVRGALGGIHLVKRRTKKRT
jgi:hypothetical protein